MIVGLTGGIGSGKSTVAQGFRELGVTVLDADEITHALLATNQTVIQIIVQHFGTHILQSDGTLNRAKIRSIVFESSEERHWLEALLHPLIKEEILARVSHAKSPYTIVEIPLLIEGYFQKDVQRILVVDCDENIQITRVTKRDAMPEKVIQDILKSQTTRKTRLANANEVIENNGDRESLKKAVLALHHYYTELSNKKISG